MLYIDVKYITIVGAQLRNFKRKNATTYNCSCPICGDSTTKLSKARGYFLAKGNAFYYHCHNCGISLALSTFLKKVFPAQYQEYAVEKYKNNKDDYQPVVLKSEPAKLKKIESTNATSLDVLPNVHYAKEYILARQIPEDKLHLLYYTDDFAKLTEELFPGQYTNLPEKDPRIVIPFFDKEGNVIGLQGRSLDGNNKLRYITARANKEIALIYGQDRLDLTKDILVVEGPIDSLFLPNAIAVASSDLERCLRVIPEIHDCVLVFDNEPRNKEIVKLVNAAIENHRKVCLWPSSIEEKDINDMVRAGLSKEDVLKTIKENTFSGIRAKMKFIEWKKC